MVWTSLIMTELKVFWGIRETNANVENRMANDVMIQLKTYVYETELPLWRHHSYVYI